MLWFNQLCRIHCGMATVTQKWWRANRFKLVGLQSHWHTTLPFIYFWIWIHPMQLYLHPEDPECMYLVTNSAAKMNQDYSEERMKNLVRDWTVINSQTDTTLSCMWRGQWHNQCFNKWNQALHFGGTMGHDCNISWRRKYSPKKENSFPFQGDYSSPNPKGTRRQQFSEIFIYLSAASQKVEGISREDK